MARDRIQSRGGFVQDQDLRITAERQAERKVGRHPLREAAPLSMQGQPKQPQRAIDHRLIPMSCRRTQEGTQLRDRHVQVESVRLADVPDARVELYAVVRDVVAQEARMTTT